MKTKNPEETFEGLPYALEGVPGLVEATCDLQGTQNILRRLQKPPEKAWGRRLVFS